MNNTFFRLTHQGALVVTHAMLRRLTSWRCIIIIITSFTKFITPMIFPDHGVPGNGQLSVSYTASSPRFLQKISKVSNKRNSRLFNLGEMSCFNQHNAVQ